ncbi:MAG: hypothetical protein CVU56_03415 [Deltaproteobacteria bacterium HGW-Deltaproteobacteria-14]|jgi:diguanylate cyclase (GGDEF)-like protein|nr:MAG: hypothetical protein CVU56_03415 [Deltaproteobacteria bacterium HGW-Deltaproteobacteria-14]
MREPWRGAVILVAALLTVLGVMWLDAVTGPDLGFALFYLVPVAIAAWWLGTGAAVVVALGAAAAWYLAEAPSRPAALHLAVVWNAATRAVIFTVTGALLARLRKRERALARVNARLAQVLADERLLARRDPLTELANWRGFQDGLEREAARARRAGGALVVAYIDLDNFKALNDAYGHAVGNTVLADFGRALAATSRREDVAARIGGDEFAVLLVGADRAHAEAFGARVVEVVRELGAPYPLAHLGASVGVASAAASEVEAEQLVRLADGAMYDAKAAGKARVAVRWLEAAPRPDAPEPDA